MSFRENIEIFHQLDTQKYLEILKNEYGAKDHPDKAGSYLIDEPAMPFYQPRQMEDHISILGFNNTFLSALLIESLINFPELAPDNVLVRWTQEQDLIMEKTLGELRKMYEKTKGA